MSWAVLIRAGNVGSNSFRPSRLPDELPDLRLVNLGAAGTLVARGGRSAAAVAAAVRSRLSFDAPVFVLSEREVLDLLADARPAPQGARRFATVAAAPLSAEVSLPLEVPSSGEWGVRVLGVHGRIAVGHYRRPGTRMYYPNEVIERAYGTSATTRWWETMEAVGRLLGTPAPEARTPRPRSRRAV
jgi:uncharacterized protein (DUF1697 family)